MNTLKSVFRVKFLLSLNPYIILFFPLLIEKGLDGEEVLLAIAIGTWVMVFGNFVTSYIVDIFGPKRPMIIFAFLQGLVQLSLLFVKSLNSLILFEVGMGISFPAIYGVDSKWLRFLHHNENNNALKNEKVSQMLLWLAQIISVLIGLFFLRRASLVIILNSLFYFSAVPILWKLPDIPHQKRKPINKIRITGILRNIRSEPSQLLLLFLLSISFGFVASFSWLFQYVLKDYAFNGEITFAFLQLAGATLSLAGNAFSAHLKKNHGIIIVFFMIIIGLFFSLYIKNTYVLLSIALLALFARGAINLSIRENIHRNGLFSNHIATAIAISGGVSKAMSSGIILVWSQVLYKMP